MATKRPLVRYSDTGRIEELRTSDSLPGGGGGFTVYSGTGTLSFGSTPGTSVVETTITGQTEIVSASKVKVWLNGQGSTASHNSYEHQVLGRWITLSVSAISVGTSFTVTAISDLRLTGNFEFNWEYL